MEPNVPQASFVFSLREDFSMQFQPWNAPGAGNDLSSPFHPKSFPDCQTLTHSGDAEVHLWH